MVRLRELAKWLLDNSMDVVAIDVERIHSSHLNVMEWVELKRLTSLDGAELEAFKEMTNLADHIFFSRTADDVIRASFTIQRVWNEPFNNHNSILLIAFRYHLLLILFQRWCKIRPMQYSLLMAAVQEVLP